MQANGFLSFCFSTSLVVHFLSLSTVFLSFFVLFLVLLANTTFHYRTDSILLQISAGSTITNNKTTTKQQQNNNKPSTVEQKKNKTEKIILDNHSISIRSSFRSRGQKHINNKITPPRWAGWYHEIKPINKKETATKKKKKKGEKKKKKKQIQTTATRKQDNRPTFRNNRPPENGGSRINAWQIIKTKTINKQKQKTKQLQQMWIW